MEISGIGKRIINLREKQNWTQRELAKRVGISPSVMNRIELEERPIKDYELDIIASILQTTTDFLLGRELYEKHEAYDTGQNIQQLLQLIGLEELDGADFNLLNQEDLNEIKGHLSYIIYRAKRRRQS